MTGQPPDTGLARERTTLAWVRTAMALIGNGVLVIIRHQKAFPIQVSAVLAGLSLAVALVGVGYTAHRARTVHQSRRDIGPAPGFLIMLGVMVTVLCVATGIAIIGWG